MNTRKPDLVSKQVVAKDSYFYPHKEINQIMDLMPPASSSSSATPLLLERASM